MQLKPFCLKLVIAFLLISSAVKGYSFAVDQAETSGICFIQNRGQWPGNVLYQAEIPWGWMYLEKGNVMWNMYDGASLHDKVFHGSNSTDSIIRYHAFRMWFEGADQNARVVANRKLESVHNYFIGNDPAHWAGGCSEYMEIRYEEIWPGIDWVVYGGSQVKWEFQVKPGADPSQIRLKYEGVEGLKSIAEGWQIQTSLGTMDESGLKAWESGSELRRVVRPCVKENRILFEVDQWSGKDILVIDPTLIFSSFTGSSADNFGFTATYDDTGNLYGGGIAFGAGYPVTTGAYSMTYNGGNRDISITKFNPNGTARVYSTYLGGIGFEQPHSLVVNSNNELYVLGTTNSSNFPVPSGYDATPNGGYDIIVARFNASGSNLLSATYMGGSGDDGVNISLSAASATATHRNYGDAFRGEINLDSAGYVYVASCSRSTLFPTTPGAPQTTANGMQDGVAFKLNPSLSSLVWSTFLGGNNDDAAFGITVDRFANAIVTGGTLSPNFPATPGVLHNTFQGTVDGFVASINPAGTTINRSTFIGTSAADQSYFVQTDKAGNVYILGQTGGNYPVSAGVYSNPGSGQFITKLNPNLSAIIYSTVFGAGTGTPEVSPTAFLVDLCEYVYVSAWGGGPNFFGSTNGFPTTPGAFQTTTDGHDLYFAVFRKDMLALDYATFMGGNGTHEHVDGGTSRFDKEAVIYQAVCAGCWGSSNFPTTPGVVGPNNLAVSPAGCNLAVVKMSFPMNRVIADFTVSPLQGCSPLHVNISNQTSGATTYSWTFGNGNTSASVSPPSQTYNNAGTYLITLIASNPGSCNLTDTSWASVTVIASPNLNVPTPPGICAGQSVTLTASGAGTYVWSPGTGLSGNSGPSVTSTPPGTITYTVIGNNANQCFDTAQVTVTVNPNPTAGAGNDTTICRNTQAHLHGTGGGSYSWSPAGTLVGANTANPTGTPSGNTTYILTVTNNFNCIDKDTVQVNVSQVLANAGPDVAYCVGQSGTLNGSGGGQYQWSPSAGLTQPGQASTGVNTGATRWYMLTVTDGFGCQDADSVLVTVNPLPVVAAFNDTSICLNQTANLSANGAQNYAWAPGGSGQQISVSPNASSWFVVTGTDANGCQNRDSVFVTIWPLPLAIAGADVAACRDSLVQLSGSGGLVYLWSPAAAVSDPNSANPTTTLQQTTDLVLRVTDANGCQDEDSVNIRVIQPPDVVVPPELQICKGEGARIVASGAETYLWGNGETTSYLNVNPDSGSTYTVIGFNEGCPGQPVSTHVAVIDSFPAADFIPDPDSGWIPLDVQFHNLSNGAVSWTWEFGDGGGSNLFEPAHLYEDSGYFLVSLVTVNEFGCRDTAWKRVYVKGGFTLFVPNAFSPNGDGRNDGFHVNYIGVKNFNVLIFDRWGNLIYESNDRDFVWNGTFHNLDCQEGVYTWVIKGLSYLGDEFFKAGTVTLIR